MVDTSPMTECYFTNEDEEISCVVCGKRLGIAHKRFKNMRFENGTYKHLLRYEKYEVVSGEAVCVIEDYTTGFSCYVCKEHQNLSWDIKKETLEPFQSIIESMKKEFENSKQNQVSV